MSNIVYRSDIKLKLEETLNLYHNCSLGERRPLTDKTRFQAMLNNVNLIVTAWENTQLVGIARCLTDFVYTTYLAVDEHYQKLGIGKQLIKEVQKSTASECTTVLLSAPQAVNYYPHLGFSSHPSAWTLKNT